MANEGFYDLTDPIQRKLMGPMAVNPYLARLGMAPLASGPNLPTIGQEPPAPAAAPEATPAAAPGDLWSQYQKAEKDHPIQSALSRALTGFAEGMKNTPAGAAYNPGLGAIAGGLAGAGESALQRQQLQISLQKPYNEAQQRAAAEEPYKIEEHKRSQQDILERQKSFRDSVNGSGPQVAYDDKGNPFYLTSSGWHPEVKPGAAQDQKNLDQVVREAFTVVNPAKAPRGSLLGTAGQMNRKADEIIATLSKPIKTPQDISRGVDGLASLMQGGSPQDIAIKQSEYGNIYNDLANLNTKLTGKPSDANTPEIVDEIKRVANVLRQVNNKIITDNLQNYEDLHQNLGTHKGWIKFKGDILKQNSVGAEPAAAAPSAPAKNWTGSDVHVYPDGTKAKYVQGQGWVKQ